LIVLFVCASNLNRSHRAAEVFGELAKKAGYKVTVESAGIKAFPNMEPSYLLGAYGVSQSTQITREMASKTDKLIVLDQLVEANLIKLFEVPREKIINLEIPDIYSKLADNLTELYDPLEEKLEPLIQEICQNDFLTK